MKLTRAQFQQLCMAAKAIREAATRFDTPTSIQQILLRNAGNVSAILAECWLEDNPEVEHIPGLVVIEAEA